LFSASYSFLFLLGKVVFFFFFSFCMVFDLGEKVIHFPESGK
jgi:hypothetical protein